MLLITKDGAVQTTNPVESEPVTFGSLAFGVRFLTDSMTMIKLPPYGEMDFNAIGMRGLGWRIAEDKLVKPMGQVWHIQEAK